MLFRKPAPTAPGAPHEAPKIELLSEHGVPKDMRSLATPALVLIRRAAASRGGGERSSTFVVLYRKREQRRYPVFPLPPLAALPASPHLRLHHVVLGLLLRLLLLLVVEALWVGRALAGASGRRRRRQRHHRRRLPIVLLQIAHAV
eukprot:351548-Chlamydomonas_euryale.AAC.11